MKSRQIAAVCSTLAHVLASIAALSTTGALGSEVSAQLCGSSGDLIYIGRTRSQSSTVWPSTTAPGDGGPGGGEGPGVPGCKG